MTIVSNTLTISTSFGDYLISKAYLSANSSNNILNLIYTLGPFVNGYYNASIIIYDGNTTTTEYVTLQGFSSNNI